MKATLQELNKSMGGIIGSFVISENGNVLASELPEIMSVSLTNVSSTLHHVVNVIKTNRTVEKITVDSDSAKVIATPVDGRILVVITEKGINLPLFKLMSNMAVSKLKGAPGQAAAAEVEQTKVSVDPDKLCDIYGQMFKAAAANLAVMLGPAIANKFEAELKDKKLKYSALLGDVGFNGSGQPNLSKLKLNARNVSKDELLAGLDDLLASMMEVVTTTAGPKITERAQLEIYKIKEKYKDDLK